MRSLATRIRELADEHKRTADVMFADDYVAVGISHQQFSSELYALIINQRECTMPEWIKCPSCGRINRYTREYCNCGARVELF